MAGEWWEVGGAAAGEDAGVAQRRGVAVVLVQAQDVAETEPHRGGFSSQPASPGFRTTAMRRPAVVSHRTAPLPQKMPLDHAGP